LQNEKNAPWFYAEPCRAEKHVQEYKKNRSRTELNGFRVYRVTLKTLNPKPWGGGDGFSVTIAPSTGCPLLLIVDEPQLSYYLVSPW